MSTLDDLLADPGFALREVVPGPRVRLAGAATTEVVDPRPWLRGDELVLTTGVRLRSVADQRSFVAHLVEAGAAALGFGTGLGHDRVPRSVRETAREAGLPVVEVPYDTPFIAMAGWLAERERQGFAAELDRHLAIHHDLTEQLLGAGGLEAFCARLHRHLRADVVVLDRQGTVLARSPLQPWPSAALAALLAEPDGLRLVEPTEADGRSVHLLPVLVDGRVVAGLAVRGRGPAAPEDAVDAGLRAFAVGLVGLELKRQQAVRQARREQQGQVLDDVVRAALPASEAARRLASLGVDPADRHRVMVGEVATDKAGLSALPWPVVPREADPDDTVVTAVVDQQLVVVCREDERLPVEVTAAAVLRALQALGPGATVGIGAAYAGVDGLRWSYFEARNSLRDGPGVRLGGPLTVAQLVTGSPQVPLRELSRSVLGSLLASDGEDGEGPLVTTLRTFLELDASVNATADALFVHRNTVHQRLRTVEGLTGTRLGATRDRVQLWLSLVALGLVAH